MKSQNILIVGGSKGIGKACLSMLSKENSCINISRTSPGDFENSYRDIRADVIEDPIPDLDVLDTIIYCPGSINLKPISSLKLEDFESDFRINVMGAIRVIKKYLPLLKRSDNANIILFSTVATKLGMPFHASVAAAKSAVEGLTISLAAELAPNIRVNAIAPTVTDTPLAARLLRNEKAVENIKSRHPLGRVIEPEEIAAMIQFLIGPGAKNISGQIFPIDSGIVSMKV